jgi:hypothetical protein
MQRLFEELHQVAPTNFKELLPTPGKQAIANSGVVHALAPGRNFILSVIGCQSFLSEKGGVY